MVKKKLIAEIAQAPSRFHRSPADIVRDRRFNDDERLEILDAWEREIRQTGGEDAETRLKHVAEARREIAARRRPAP
jgi:hypothetical protein